MNCFVDIYLWSSCVDYKCKWLLQINFALLYFVDPPVSPSKNKGRVAESATYSQNQSNPLVS